MWDIEWKLIDTDKSMVVTRGKGGGWVVKGKGGQIYGDKRQFDRGWWVHNAIHRSCVIEMYILNLYGLIDQCHPDTFNKNKGFVEWDSFVFFP